MCLRDQVANDPNIKTNILYLATFKTQISNKNVQWVTITMYVITLIENESFLIEFEILIFHLFRFDQSGLMISEEKMCPKKNQG